MIVGYMFDGDQYKVSCSFEYKHVVYAAKLQLTLGLGAIDSDNT